MWDAVGVGGRIEQAGFSRNYVGLNAERVLKPTVFFHISLLKVLVLLERMLRSF